MNEPLFDDLAVSVSITQTLIQALKSCGVSNTDALLQQAGIDPQQLDNSDNRIHFSQQLQLWGLAIAHAGELFPLKFAQQTQIASFNLIGYIAMNSQTIGDAIGAAEQYQMAAGQGGTLTTEHSADRLIIAYQAVNPEHPTSDARSCAMLAANINLGRNLVGSEYTPLSLQLSMPCPSNHNAFDEFFQCPIEYNQAQNRMLFAPTLKDKVLPHASAELLNLMKQRAQKVLDSIVPASTVAGQVAAILSSILIGQEPDRTQIAQRLNVSQRTLQRKLAKENTSYQEILDKTRQGLALNYLNQLELSITDIAYLLGFTEPSAFYRAFKKWQGLTPGLYREQNCGQATPTKTD